MEESFNDGSNDGEKENGSDDAVSVSEHEADESQEQEQGSEGASEVASAPQSPSGSEGQQSDEEVHISEAEASDHSDNEDVHSEKGEAEEESDKEIQQSEKDNASEKGDSDVEESSDVEENLDTSKEIGNNEERGDDSDQEGSVPEINIDSGEEDNDQRPESRIINEDQDSESENEAKKDAASDNEKGTDDEDGDLVIADEVEPSSDVENANSDDEKKANSDDEKNANSDDEKQPASEKGSLHSPAAPVADSDDENDDKPTTTQDEEAAPDSNVGDLIANIFGDSDDEELAGADDDDTSAVKSKKVKRMKAAKVMSDSEDDDEDNKEANETEMEVTEGPEVPPESAEAPPPKTNQIESDDDSDEDGIRKMREDYVSDFDVMMQKKKDESSRRRKRKDVDIINDSDDLIAEIIGNMRQAADEDRVLNKQKQTATKKLRILQTVLSQLKKQDLKMAFLDQGVLNVMADWLAPLPDRSLPHLQIREGMIRQLSEFPAIDQHLLKSSGIGRALMYLHRHPRETKENKERAGKLITEWARPIFNVTTNYHSLTKEEREQRDFDHVPKKKRLRDKSDPSEPVEEKKDIDKALTGEDKTLRPGEKGWVGRARVPAPSTRDYVVRPKWNVEMEFGRGPGKKPLNRFEKHMRTIQEKKRLSKGQRAVTISIEGRKMAI